jgi:hypothetical protein
MKRSIALLGTVLLACAFQQAPDARSQVRALADAGKFDEAERLARGSSLAASLGEVLVQRSLGGTSSTRVTLQRGAVIARRRSVSPWR